MKDDEREKRPLREIINILGVITLHSSPLNDRRGMNLAKSIPYKALEA